MLRVAAKRPAKLAYDWPARRQGVTFGKIRIDEIQGVIAAGIVRPGRSHTREFADRRVEVATVERGATVLICSRKRPLIRRFSAAFHLEGFVEHADGVRGPFLIGKATCLINIRIVEWTADVAL